MLHGTAMARAAGYFSLISAVTASHGVGLARGDRHLGAVLGQPLGDRLADALGRAGDDGDLAGEVEGGVFHDGLLNRHSGASTLAELTEFVIASEAKQSIPPRKERMDCFVASLLAMTARRNYTSPPPSVTRRR